MWMSVRKVFTRVIQVHAVSIRMEDSVASVKHNLVNLVSLFQLIKLINHYCHVPLLCLYVQILDIRLTPHIKYITALLSYTFIISLYLQ